MQFEYAQYVTLCLIVPILVSLFSLYVLISYLMHLRTKIHQKKWFSRNLVNLLLVVTICSIFLSMNIGRLSHGGIHLIYEREFDAVDIQGNIEEIRELGRYSFPELKTEYGYGDKNGVQFLIGGVECTAPTRGDIAVGDNVTVTFLPQSGYILSISLKEEE